MSRPRNIWTLAEGSQFWRDGIALVQTTALRVVPRTLLVGAWSLLACALHLQIAVEQQLPVLQVVPGLVLGLLLTQRTSASYQRWWEARQLWSSLANQAKNLALGMVAYGPKDGARRTSFAARLAGYVHLVRAALREESAEPALVRLLGAAPAKHILAAPQPATVVMVELARRIRQASEACGAEHFPLLQLEACRARMVESAGGCDRIRTTPLPRVLVVTLRHLLILLLVVVPLVLVPLWGWWTPLHSMLLAYPVLAIDQIGAELERPFSVLSFSHLPLDTLCDRLERDLAAIGSATEDQANSTV